MKIHLLFISLKNAPAAILLVEPLTGMLWIDIKIDLCYLGATEHDELKSPISLVHEMALKRNLQVEFSVSNFDL